LRRRCWGLCCAWQMLVYGFAAYTEVRWEGARQATGDGTLRVVGWDGAGGEAGGGARGRRRRSVRRGRMVMRRRRPRRNVCAFDRAAAGDQGQER